MSGAPAGEELEGLEEAGATVGVTGQVRTPGVEREGRRHMRKAGGDHEAGGTRVPSL